MVWGVWVVGGDGGGDDGGGGEGCYGGIPTLSTLVGSSFEAMLLLLLSSAHFQEQPSVTRHRTADPDVAFILFDPEHGVITEGIIHKGTL
jgi:hypothetical protein